jgi:predicted DCC family thiol-disulfide oxidoreductase YuxK
MMNEQKKVVFFDGVCGLCNGFVDFLMKVDKKKSLTFSPLQSEFAKIHLGPELTQDLSTVVYLREGVKSTKSEAVISILKDVGGFWKIAGIARYLPKSFLNHLYDAVALNRYNLFGKKDSCRLPTPEERERFIS